MLAGICRKADMTTSHKAKAITMWLRAKVHPSARLFSDKSPDYWLYNDLVSFREGPKPKAFLSFWPELRGSRSFARYVFSPKSQVKIGDQVVVGTSRLAPISYLAQPKVKASYYRMPQKAQLLPKPYTTTGFAESLARLSVASSRVIPLGSTRIEYLQFFDVNHPKVEQLLTQLLLSPNPAAEKTLLDLRGPTGSVQTQLANLLPTHFQQIEKTIKKRPTYVLVDRHTEGFKQILARFLQNKGAVVLGEPQRALPSFGRFFPLVTAQPAEYYLLQLAKASKVYEGIKAPVIDTALANHLPYSNGVDTMLEKALAFLK